MEEDPAAVTRSLSDDETPELDAVVTRLSQLPLAHRRSRAEDLAMSTLHAAVDDYLTLRRAMGFTLVGHDRLWAISSTASIVRGRRRSRPRWRWHGHQILDRAAADSFAVELQPDFAGTVDAVVLFVHARPVGRR